MKRLSLYIICLLALVQTLSLQAQESTYKVFTTRQGLSSQLVTNMYQDRFGMIWIATEDGLNRYDGVKMSVYRHNEQNPNSIANDYVKQLIEDRNGNLIVNTYSGIQLYRRSTDDFSQLVTLSESKDNPSNFITLLAIGKDSLLYAIGENPCIVNVDEQSRQVSLETLNWRLPPHKSGLIQEHSDGNLWIYNDGHLNEYQLPGGIAQNQIHIKGEYDGAQKVLISDHDQGLYFADKSQLYKIEGSELKQFIRQGDVGNSSVISILRYSKDELLIGTDGNGLYLYDELTGEAKRFQVSPDPQDNLRLKVHRLMKDSEGNLWLGLYQQGIVLLSQKEPLFELLSHHSANSQLGVSAVLSICQDRSGEGYWVGTDGEGLFHTDATGSTWIGCDDPKTPSIVNAIFEDSQGGLWLGSYDSPCFYRRAGAKHFEPVTDIFNLSNPSPRVFALAEDSSKQLWLATMGNGLFCYDLDRKQRIDICSEDINLWQNCLALTTDQQMLVGTYNGIYVFDTRQQKSLPKHLCDRKIVYCIAEDSQHRLWAGTSDGLVGFSLQNDSLVWYTSSQGLPSNAVYSIQPQDDDLLWLSTGEGLACLNTVTGVCHTESMEGGLSGNDFSKGVSLHTADGKLWFGGSFGITSFDPDRLATTRHELHPRITAIYYNNVSVNASTVTGRKPVVDKAVYECARCTFSHDANSLSIELGTKELIPLAQAIFSYRLDDSDWQTLSARQNKVNLSQLRPGKHLFRYRANIGRDYSDERLFEIEIRHPWWLTAWAKLCYSIVFSALAFFLFNWWYSQKKMKMMSLVSHKIRTPLSLIVSPLLEMIAHETDPSRKKNYELMLRNAYRMQSLAEKVTKEVPLAPLEPIDDINEPVEDNAGSPAGVQQSYHPHEVLVVEDDVELRNYLIEHLSTEFKVRVAGNGKEALKMVFEKQPDAIVSDVTMPEMDGITFCKQLKKNIHLSHIPVALLTARADEKSVLHGLGIGADAYVTKPFNVSILKQTLHNFIELRTQLRNLYQGQQLQEKHLEKLDIPDSYDDRMMERIMQVVNRELANPDLNVDMLCDEVGISRSQLYRKMKEMTNQSVSNFIRNVRIKQSEQLLSQPNIRIAEVAQKVGFREQQYYNKAFKDVYGITPTQWRENRLNNVTD